MGERLMIGVFKRWREERIDKQLSAYLDGMLTPEEQVELEARLERDPALQARLDGLRLTVGALSSLPEVQAPRNFILSPSMVSTPKSAPPSRLSWPALNWATAVATLLFLVVVAGDLFVFRQAQDGIFRQAQDGIFRQAQDDIFQPTLQSPESSGPDDIVRPSSQPELTGVLIQSPTPAFYAGEERIEITREAEPGEAPKMLAVTAEGEGEGEPELEAMRMAVTAPPTEAPASDVEPEAPEMAAELEETAPVQLPPVTESADAEIGMGGGGERPLAEASAPAPQGTPQAMRAQLPMITETLPPPPGATRAQVAGEAVQAEPSPTTIVPTPLEEPPLSEATAQEGTPPWLRGLEVGLGLAALGLLLLNLFVRRRKS
jgi:hypothetical protein